MKVNVIIPRLGGILSYMRKMFRTRYLLSRLYRKGIRGAADASSIEQIVTSKLWMEKSRFLNDINTKYFFFFKRSDRSLKKRVSKDDKLLEACCADVPPKAIELTAQDLGMAYALEISPKTPFIRSTGHGDDFSDLFNFIFVSLPGKYAALWGGLVAVIGYAWAPHVLPWMYLFMCNHTGALFFCR